MKHWENVKLGDLAEKVGSGATPKGGSNAYKVSGIPLIRSMNIHFDSFHYEGLVYLDDKQAYELKNVEVKTKDVLLNITGASIGRVILAPKDLEGARVNQHVCIIRTLLALDSNFLCKYLSSPIIQRKIMAEEYGVTRQALTKQMILDFDIPLPPLNEQRRIVAKIEALKARSQRVKEELEDIPQLLYQFRQSVLAAAFRGDLTADWREQNSNVEPAEVLLERIRAERRRRWEEAELEKMKASGKTPKDDKWKEKYKEPELIDDSELSELPDGWCWEKFEIVATIASNLVQPSDYLNFPHIAPDNIEKGSGKLLEYRTIKEDGVISPKHLFSPGQILYSKIRPYLSKCVVVDFDGLCSADMYPIDSHICTDYLFYYILSDTFLELIQKESGSRVVLPKANQQQVYVIPVPVPPLDEQIEIARKINTLLVYKDSIKVTVKEQLETVEGLNQSILAKAFRGELVPQDPDDEPASVLLERIRAERAKLQTKTAKKSTLRLGSVTTTQPSTRRTKKTQPQQEESVQLDLGLE